MVAIGIAQAAAAGEDHEQFLIRVMAVKGPRPLSRRHHKQPSAQHVRTQRRSEGGCTRFVEIAVRLCLQLQGIEMKNGGRGNGHD
ncbi:hypothetical protein [Sphingopyxis sp. 113P3]|uniref:hypothetical protein n=1 Tax=Sphingopyxis sp. (strain 113P3) TaxID=292913 RepID=UPI000A4380D8|nr:hypothetical protein [Sphingopyxis sp. 113P3]